MIRYASFGRRVWAFVLTAVVDLIVLGAMRAAIGDGDVWGPFGFWYLLHHVGLVVEGGTLGHRLAGLRVVGIDGERLGVVHAFVREGARIALSFPPLALGVLWMLDQPRRQTWHDILAGSVVVREATQFEAAGPEWANDPPWRRPRPVAAPDAANGHGEDHLAGPSVS